MSFRIQYVLYYQPLKEVIAPKMRFDGVSFIIKQLVAFDYAASQIPFLVTKCLVLTV
jgi:hypothetical protein